MSLPNVKEVTANLLYGEGFHKLEDIAFADPETLVKSAGLKSEEDALKLQTAARIALKDKLEQMSFTEGEAAPPQAEAENPAEQEQ